MQGVEYSLEIEMVTSLLTVSDSLLLVEQR